MFLLRLFILLVIVALLLWLLKRLFSGAPGPQAGDEAAPAENMRQCKHCGVHVPESSLLEVNGEYYCCQEHADLDQH